MTEDNFLVIFQLTTLLLSGLFLWKYPKIKQDQNYHLFADHHKDTVSNLAFLLVGFYGLYRSMRFEDYHIFIFYLGVILTSFGSAYYHSKPSNKTLVWDRLPMTICFMSLFSLFVTRYYHQVFITGAYSTILKPLFLLLMLHLGGYSVYRTYKYDDLKLYAIVAFLPLIWMTQMIPDTFDKDYVILGLSFYLLAKASETLDHQIYNLTNKLVSGHTLKHLFASLGCLMTLYLVPPP